MIWLIITVKKTFHQKKKKTILIHILIPLKKIKHPLTIS